MDEAFMSRVAERIAAATEAVSSFSPTADPDKLPAVQTMDEWMNSHSPGSKLRCGDCKAPLVEGSTTICIACGRQLPPRLAVKPEEFSFDTSLAKTLFYESVHLEDPRDTSTDTTDELQPQSTGSGIVSNGYVEQQSASASRPGDEEVEKNALGDELGKAIVNDAGDDSIPAAPSSKPLKVGEGEEDEEYIWGSADADDFGSLAWTQQLARDSGADPKEFSSVNSSATLYSANNMLGQASSMNDEDFSAAASISADLSLSESVDTQFNFFPSASNSADQARGEQANTAGPSLAKESFDLSVGTDFHDFFQTSHPTSGDQSLDLKAQTSDPFVREGSTAQTVEDNFDDFFQTFPKARDQSHQHNEETGTSFSAEESSTQKREIDFFQVVSKSTDRGLNIETRALQKAEESSSRKTETDLEGFFRAVSEPAGHSSGLNVETPIPHTTEESNGQDGEFEADFDDFLQAASPRSTDQCSSSNEEMPRPHIVEGVSGQSGEEPFFDFFFQSPSQSTSQSRGQNAEAAAPQFPEETSGQNMEAEFDFFFHDRPVPAAAQSRGQNFEMGAPNLSKEASDQKVENQFDDFFQVSVKSANKDHGQNGEMPPPSSVDEKSRQQLQTDFDFLRSVPEAANHLSGLTVETSVSHLAEGSSGQDGGADFDDFFQAAPKPANGPVGHNSLTDFDFFFQAPDKSEDRLRGQRPQADVPNGAGKSNGQSAQPGLDDIFHAANNKVNHSHGQKVKTVAPSPAKEHLGQIQVMDFEDFFQAAPKSVRKANGHDAIENFDFFQVSAAPQGQNAPLKGQNMSMGFDDFFSTAPQSVDRPFGKSEVRGFDPFPQAAPLSMDDSPNQNGATDFDNGDFDDFVQAAPQSAYNVVGPSQSTEFDGFFHGRSHSADNSSQQRLTTDFDAAFQAAPQTTDKSSAVNASAPFDFLNTSFQSTAKSHHMAKSMDFGSLFEVAPPRNNEAAKPPSNSSGLFVHSNGSGQTMQAGGSPNSMLTGGWNSNGDRLRQLEGGHHVKKMPNDLSDLSFRLADNLVISDEAPTNMWYFN